MRWLVAHPGPGFSVHDVYAGWCEGLAELGEQVFPWNLDDRLALYDSAYMLVDADKKQFRKALTAEQAVDLALNGLAAAMWKLRPHVLLIVSGFFADYDLLEHARRTGTRVVLLCTEEPYEADRELALAEHVDVCLLNDPTHLGRFQQVTTAEYVPHAYRPALHHPGPPTAGLECDLGFVGTGYPSRIKFFEAMGLDGLTVKLGGNWMRLKNTGSPLREFMAHDLDDCMDNEDAVLLYRSAKVGLNLYRVEAAHPELRDGWSMGPRELEMAATGLFFLRDPRPEGDELFPMLPSFKGPDDAAEQARWWAARDTARESAAELAREAVHERTFRSNAQALLRLLDRAPVTT